MKRRFLPPAVASRLIELGTLLAQGAEGHCFSCTRLFTISESKARIAQTFCSLSCERAFFRHNLKHLTLTDCRRILEQIESLLKLRERTRR
jgi:hypothetical protein